MPTSLTSVAVKNAKADPLRRRELPDGGSGLYLVIQPTGARSWALRYRFEGKPVKLTLGPAIWLESGERESEVEPEIGKPLTLKDARALANALLRKVARGHNPATAKRAAREAKAGEDPDLFEIVALNFIERYAKGANRESSWRETARLLGFKPDPADPTKLVRRKAVKGAFSGVADQWAGRRVQDIKRRDVITLLDTIVDGGAPFSANRVFAALRRLFNWCIERDRLAVSPCAGVRPPTAEVSRDRVLSDSELHLIWRACATLGEPFGPFIKLLLLTGQRRDEVAEMTWAEVDRAEGSWRLPRERVKNDTAHEVPLSAQTLAVLDALTKVEGKPAYVFTTGNGRRKAAAVDTSQLAPISGFSKAKLKLDEAIMSLRRMDAVEAGEDADALQAWADWRFHDLRRTVASGMARLGIALPVIEKVLNHKSGSFAGIVGVYQRHSYSDEKRSALQAWGNFVEALGSPARSTNVVPMQQVAG